MNCKNSTIIILPAGCLGHNEIDLQCKAPEEAVYYQFSLANRLTPNDMIMSVSAWPSDEMVGVDQIEVKGQIFKARISGGTVNTKSGIRFLVSTRSGEVREFVVTLPVAPAGILGTGAVGHYVLGDTGPEGKQGKAATIAIGKVLPTDSDGDPKIENIGTDTDAVLNFTLPRGITGLQGKEGPKGDKGDNGAIGPQGKAGTQILQSNRDPVHGDAKENIIWLNTVTGDLFETVPTGNDQYSWSKTGNLKGKAGNIIYSGNSDPILNDVYKENDLYFNNISNDVFVFNSNQWTRIANLKGENGIRGSVFFYNSQDPVGSKSYHIGDCYLNTSTYDFFVYNGDNWQRVGNLKGGQGLKGEKGDSYVNDGSVNLNVKSLKVGDYGFDIDGNIRAKEVDGINFFATNETDNFKETASYNSDSIVVKKINKQTNQETGFNASIDGIEYTNGDNDTTVKIMVSGDADLAGKIKARAVDTSALVSTENNPDVLLQQVVDKAMAAENAKDAFRNNGSEDLNVKTISSDNNRIYSDGNGRIRADRITVSTELEMLDHSIPTNDITARMFHVAKSGIIMDRGNLNTDGQGNMSVKNISSDGNVNVSGKIKAKAIDTSVTVPTAINPDVTLEQIVDKVLSFGSSGLPMVTVTSDVINDSIKDNINKHICISYDVNKQAQSLDFAKGKQIFNIGDRIILSVTKSNADNINDLLNKSVKFYCFMLPDQKKYATIEIDNKINYKIFSTNLAYGDTVDLTCIDIILNPFTNQDIPLFIVNRYSTFHNDGSDHLIAKTVSSDDDKIKSDGNGNLVLTGTVSAQNGFWLPVEPIDSSAVKEGCLTFDKNQKTISWYDGSEWHSPIKNDGTTSLKVADIQPTKLLVNMPEDDGKQVLLDTQLLYEKACNNHRVWIGGVGNTNMASMAKVAGVDTFEKASGCWFTFSSDGMKQPPILIEKAMGSFKFSICGNDVKNNTAGVRIQAKIFCENESVSDPTGWNWAYKDQIFVLRMGDVLTLTGQMVGGKDANGKQFNDVYYWAELSRAENVTSSYIITDKTPPATLTSKGYQKELRLGKNGIYLCTKEGDEGQAEWIEYPSLGNLTDGSIDLKVQSINASNGLITCNSGYTATYNAQGILIKKDSDPIGKYTVIINDQGDFLALGQLSGLKISTDGGSLSSDGKGHLKAYSLDKDTILYNSDQKSTLTVGNIVDKVMDLDVYKLKYRVQISNPSTGTIAIDEATKKLCWFYGTHWYDAMGNQFV